MRSTQIERKLNESLGFDHKRLRSTRTLTHKSVDSLFNCSDFQFIKPYLRGYGFSGYLDKWIAGDQDLEVELEMLNALYFKNLMDGDGFSFRENGEFQLLYKDETVVKQSKSISIFSPFYGSFVGKTFYDFTHPDTIDFYYETINLLFQEMVGRGHDMVGIKTEGLVIRRRAIIDDVDHNACKYHLTKKYKNIKGGLFLVEQ